MSTKVSKKDNIGSEHTELVGDFCTFLHELTRRISKPRHVVIAWPVRLALEPKRLFLVVHAGTRTQLGLRKENKYRGSDWDGDGIPHFIFPSIVGLSIMGSFALYISREIKESLGNRELGLNVFLRDTMINQGKETSILGCLYQLCCDFVFALLKVWDGCQLILRLEGLSISHL